jgi:hypothetical protein
MVSTFMRPTRHQNGWGQPVFSQEKLWNLIESVLRACRNVLPADEMDKQRQIIEIATLTRHLEWTKQASDDQAILEEIISSLEENIIVPYRNWRELSTLTHRG